MARQYQMNIAIVVHLREKVRRGLNEIVFTTPLMSTKESDGENKQTIKHPSRMKRK